MNSTEKGDTKSARSSRMSTIPSKLDITNLKKHLSYQPFSVVETPPAFYSKAKDYWSHVPATVDGMLGGFTSLNVPDIADSQNFLDTYGPSTTAYALDCGSGIGRITKQLLLPRFSLVDMADVNQAFLDQTENFIGPEDFSRIGERFCVGLQDFTPPVGRYDLIWIQWVLGHLSDMAMIAFFRRCAQALSTDGVIVVKENVTTADGPAETSVLNSRDTNFDETDCSYTRPRAAFIQTFQEAGLKLCGEQAQKNFPLSLYPVRMFALQIDYSTEQLTN